MSVMYGVFKVVDWSQKCISNKLDFMVTSLIYQFCGDRMNIFEDMPINVSANHVAAVCLDTRELTGTKKPEAILYGDEPAVSMSGREDWMNDLKVLKL